MRDRRGQTTLELLAIFATVGMLVTGGVAGARHCWPETYGAVRTDIRFAARDLNWAMGSLSGASIGELYDAKNRRIMEIIGPANMTQAPDLVHKANIALR